MLFELEVLEVPSEIDIVITWVDGTDEDWLRSKALYEGKDNGDSGKKRYRDWGLLKYWFRGIERFAPWVRCVHFVSAGQVPDWLNAGNERLHIVRHDEFIPHEYLPTFSCRPIEFNLHRIPGLAEQFVYFNDDMFLISKTNVEDFFRNGLPCDSAILDAAFIFGGDVGGKRLPVEEYNSSPAMNMVPLNRNFDKRVSMRSNWSKWVNPRYGVQGLRSLLLMPWKRFTGIKSFHVPYSLLKTTFDEVWEHEPELLARACSHRFRNSSDVSSRLLSYWQLAEGEFFPRNPAFGRMYYITGGTGDVSIYEAIEKGEYKALCLNDEYEGDDFECVRDRLIARFAALLPNKSAFEV